MLRVQSNKNIIGFTEYEEDILFDEDDPDFDASLASIPISLLFRGGRNKVQQSQLTALAASVSNMSLVGLHPRTLHSNHSSLSSLSYSLDDIASCCSPHFNSEHVLTIEELRLQMSSCFTCGVSWAEYHVSLDCSECGGYALERPCPSCEGSCGAVWKRELTKSHASNKAHWEGECKLLPKNSTITSSGSSSSLKKATCSQTEKMSHLS